MKKNKKITKKKNIVKVHLAGPMIVVASGMVLLMTFIFLMVLVGIINKL